MKNRRFFEFPPLRTGGGNGGTDFKIPQLGSTGLKKQLCLEAAAPQAIFDPQNRQNRGFSRRAAGKNGGHRNLTLPPKTRPLGGVVCQFSEKSLEDFSGKPPLLHEIALSGHPL